MDVCQIGSPDLTYITVNLKKLKKKSDFMRSTWNISGNKRFIFPLTANKCIHTGSSDMSRRSGKMNTQRETQIVSIL